MYDDVYGFVVQVSPCARAQVVKSPESGNYSKAFRDSWSLCKVVRGMRILRFLNLVFSMALLPTKTPKKWREYSSLCLGGWIQ